MSKINFWWIPLLGLSWACSPPDPLHTLQGEWQLWAYQDLATGQRDLAPEYLPQPVLGNFDDRGRRGNYRIETATNAMWGQYRLQPPENLEMKEVNGTLRGENQWTRRLWDALRATHGYELSPGRDTLWLYYQDHQRRVVWVRP